MCLQVDRELFKHLSALNKRALDVKVQIRVPKVTWRDVTIETRDGSHAQELATLSLYCEILFKIPEKSVKRW